MIQRALNDWRFNMLTQVCSKCGMELPLTKEYFRPRKDRKSGFRAECKECEKSYNKQDRPNYYFSHLSKDKMEVKGSLKLHSKNRFNRSEYMKAYIKSENGKARFESYKNREWFKESKKRRDKKYKNSEKGHEKVLISNAKRKNQKIGVDANFSIKDWEFCKTFFNNKCAYCGINDIEHQDHFKALSRGGGYTKDNIIPACTSCNCSKNNKDFFEWYQTKAWYSKDREQKILSYLESISATVL